MVYFELDLTDPYTVSALSSCQLLPQGENLQDVLPRDIYRRLKRHLDYVKLMMPTWVTPDQRGRGLYADYLFNAIAGNWERKRPIWVMLMVNSLTESDIKTRGVPVLDLYLAQEAERMRKRTGAVEKVEEQCHPLNRLNFSQVSPNRTILKSPLSKGQKAVEAVQKHLEGSCTVQESFGWSRRIYPDPEMSSIVLKGFEWSIRFWLFKDLQRLQTCLVWCRTVQKHMERSRKVLNGSEDSRTTIAI